MDARLNYWKAAPELGQAMLKLHKEIDAAGLDATIIHLVKLRASQMNACAHCIELHSREARLDGISAARVDLLPVWRESSFYTPREQAALEWTEALTKLGDDSPDDALYAKVSAEFSDEDMVKLTAIIGMINFWNRFSIGFATPHAGA